MCWRCDEIDKKIAHYRELAGRITDEQSLRGIDLLIAKLEATKKELHSEEHASLLPDDSRSQHRRDF